MDGTVDMWSPGAIVAVIVGALWLLGMASGSIDTSRRDREERERWLDLARRSNEESSWWNSDQ